MSAARVVRTDANQTEIVRALREVGFYVFVTSAAGKGFPDLVAVRRDGRCYLLEVKTEHGHLRPEQLRVMVGMVNPAYRIFTCAEDAVRAMIEDGTAIETIRRMVG